jgi:hypothetical protein
MSVSGTFAKVSGPSLTLLRQRALEALQRAGLVVRVVAANDARGLCTISVEDKPAPAGLTPDDAARYAASINNEAELARGLLLALAELERLQRELAELRGSEPALVGTDHRDPGPG